METATVTLPCKSITCVAKRLKCPRKYPRHVCDEMRTSDSAIRIYFVPTRETVSVRRWSPGATSRPELREVDVSFRCGDGRKQEIPKRCHEHLKFQRFEHVLSQKCLPLRLLLRVSCEIVGQAEGDAGGNAVLRRSKVARIARRRMSPSNSVWHDNIQRSKKSFIRLLAMPSAAIASSFSATTV